MKSIDNDIKAGQLKRMYLLFGEETYLIRQYRDKLVHALVAEGDTMNFSRFEGSDINQKEIIDLAETLPFFAERRVILLEDSGLFKRGAEELADYMASVPESTFFLFVEQEADSRTKMYKEVKKLGRVVEFSRQTDEILARWIEGRIRKNGKNITREAYALFIEKTGPDMENIDRELEKLLCYTLEKEAIEASDVMAVTTEQTENKIFEMVDAVAAHQQKKALDLYYDLLSLKEPAMRILYLISHQLQRLLVVKAMMNQGFSNRDIAAKAGCPEWAVRKYQSQCRAFSVEQLKSAVRDGVSYEESVKTGHMQDQLAVELFLMSVSGKSGTQT
ncbi:MAG: DNA polymerase III subunit delta [Muribaculaceae bacterium]|nr:DNA polymerase III subunit delta [Roseburia sp.]MCM1431194.1 DNA polymerase III subunit delta [Muribaculaceae bacterium]MCM1492320.1 DNA polymerase III subunit delta [Muribaculaceae bacterium]